MIVPIQMMLYMYSQPLMEKKLQSNGFSFNNRNYLIDQLSYEPSLSYIYKAIFRGTIAIGFVKNENRIDSMEKSQTFSFTSRIKYNVFSKSTIDAKLTLSKIKFDAFEEKSVTSQDKLNKCHYFFSKKISI